MALLWVIHTLLMIFVYRELQMRPQPETPIDDGDDDCFEREITNGSVPNSSIPPHEISQYRDRSPSRFFSYVSNGM